MATRVWAPGEFINPGDLRQPRTVPPVVTSALTNGDLEAGNSGWTSDNPSLVITNVGAGFAFDGSWAIKHDTALIGTYGIRNNNVVPVVPGQTIKAGCRYRRETNVSGRQTMSVVIEWLNSGMTVIGISEYNQQGGATGVWYDPSVTGIAPTGAAFAQFAIYSFNSAAGGAHSQYFDGCSWNYVQPVAQSGLVYKAVQANAGFTAATEPVWPIVLGATVVDNEVTWEAVLASNVTWEATPILLSAATEPTWPVEVGATVLDGTIAWRAISRRIEDENCPNTKAVAIAASKVFAVDRDIVRFSATVNPLDWTTRDDAGYLPTGLQTYGSNDAAALGLYRSNLVVFNSQGFQMWQVDQDPANMAFLDAVPVGSTYPHTWQPIANDLAGLTAVGVRNVSIAGASTNLQADGVGEPIDPLVKAAIKELESDDDVISLFWPAMGQYWIIFGDEAFVLTINGAKKKSWSRYVFPSEVTDATLAGNTLVLRSGTKVWDMSDEALRDDIYTVGDPVVLSLVQAGTTAELSWTAANTTGVPAVDYYRVFRSANGGAFTQIATVPLADPRTHDDTDLADGTYQYYVDYVDTAGNTADESNTVQLVIATQARAVATGTVARYSDDGATWLPGVIPATGLIYSHVAFAPDLVRWAALATSGAAADRCITSEDGINWTARTAPEQGYTAIAYGNGTFVAMAGAFGVTEYATSPDGITWTARNMPTSQWESVIFAPFLGMFVAGRNNSGNNIALSADGITWTTHAFPASSVSHLACGETHIVAVTSDSAVNSYRSTDGTTWELVLIDLNTGAQALYGDREGAMVVSSTTFRKYSVDDGGSWSLATAGQPISWADGTNIGSRMLLVAGGNIYSSDDNGINFTVRLSSVSVDGLAAGFQLV